MEKFSSSMQLTRAADYAVRVMIHLATLTDNERAMLPALADATGARRILSGLRPKGPCSMCWTEPQ